jgi:nucleoside-diphosphate-sugar epimerase
MPKQTAANLFIERALKGEPMTPFKDTQHRPMLYVNVQDVCKAFENYAGLVLDETRTSRRAIPSIVNLVYPKPVTIIELAKIVRESVIKLTKGKRRPEIKVVDRGMRSEYTPQRKRQIKVDITKARKELGLVELIGPKESIEEIVAGRLRSLGQQGAT